MCESFFLCELHIRDFFIFAFRILILCGRYGTSPQDSTGIRVRQPFKNSLGSSALQNKEVSPLLQPRQANALPPSLGDSGDDFVLISDAGAVAEQEWQVSLCPRVLELCFLLMSVIGNSSVICPTAESASCRQCGYARDSNAHKNQRRKNIERFGTRLWPLVAFGVHDDQVGCAEGLVLALWAVELLT